MRPIATWSFAPWRRGLGTPWYRTDYFLACARASIEYMNRHYGRPVIYTDTLGKRVFSAITDCADYEVVDDDIEQQYPNTLWAMAKILTYQRQTEPYLHFDLDVLVLKPLRPELFDCDILAMAVENMETQDPVKAAQIARVYNVPTVGQFYDLPEFMRDPDINHVSPVNAGLLYIRDMDLNRAYTQAALDIYNRHRDLFRTDQRLHICVLEQQVLTMLARQRGSQVNTVLGSIFQGPIEELISDEVVHFITFSKRAGYPRSQEYHTQYLDPWIDERVQRVAVNLDKINPQKNAAHAIINK